MAALSRRIVAALTVAYSLSAMLVVGPASPAAADGREGTQYVVGHRFEPGPIVGGYRRQPTRGEFEARMRELRAPSQRSVVTGSAPLLSPTAGDMASVTRPASALSTSKR
jgi:hypothetical protein